MEKTHLTGLTKKELVKFAEECGEPGWRGKQLFKQIQAQRRFSFDEMTDLPKRLRQTLQQVATVSVLKLESRFISVDGTRRYLMKTRDGFPVETVFIPSENRDTICFSSQSGCPLKCDFCLTAKLGFLRSLSTGEIVEQILVVLNDVYGVGNKPPRGTNLVGMGEGEPFLNFENLMKAIEIIYDDDGLSIVPNRITISTAGVVPKIYEFAKLKNRPHLAISLSATTDELRDRLMPINRRWNIEKLMQAAFFFHQNLRPRERLTFEYVLLKGVNDLERHAVELAHLLKKHKLKRVKVNLIPHNSGEGLDYLPPDEEKVKRFKTLLEAYGIPAYIRRPRGRDIYAACGQLAAKVNLST